MSLAPPNLSPKEGSPLLTETAQIGAIIASITVVSNLFALDAMQDFSKDVLRMGEGAVHMPLIAALVFSLLVAFSQLRYSQKTPLSRSLVMSIVNGIIIFALALGSNNGYKELASSLAQPSGHGAGASFTAAGTLPGSQAPSPQATIAALQAENAELRQGLLKAQGDIRRLLAAFGTIPTTSGTSDAAPAALSLRFHLGSLLVADAFAQQTAPVPMSRENATPLSQDDLDRILTDYLNRKKLLNALPNPSAAPVTPDAAIPPDSTTIPSSARLPSEQQQQIIWR